MTNWGPQGQEVFERTYSRLKKDGTKETWPETVSRVVDGNIALVPSGHILPDERARLFSLMLDMKVLPAGRHLWTSGVPGRQFNRNCHRAGWSARLADHFGFTFDELMKGGGVGSNYSNEYLTQTAPLQSRVDLFIACDEIHPNVDEVAPDWFGQVSLDRDMDQPADECVYLLVEDSREGWVTAVEALCDMAQTPSTDAPAIVIDVSDVRGSGEPLRGFGGTASGPGPLVQALRALNEHLNRSVATGLSGLAAMSIDHALAACVVAGNVRRSARMSIMHWADPQIFDFIVCKSDFADHWTTNISVEIDDDYFAAIEHEDVYAMAVRDAVLDGMLANGEPGFFNSTLASVGEDADARCTNPCGEIALNEWESCNLGHVNLAAFAEPSPAMQEAFTLMARFLLRATFAELLNPLQSSVEADNRRIGVGFFGFQEWLGQLGIRYSEASTPAVSSALADMKRWVVEAADSYADALDIPRPIKHTTVAPTGTIAKLAGVTEGIHPIYARYFVRRVRYANHDEGLGRLIAEGYTTEPCIYSANTTVVLFHVRDPLMDRVSERYVEQADDLTVAAKLAVQRLVQEHYANNAVSYTVNLADDTTPSELRKALDENLHALKGTTVFPFNSRPQSPYTAITQAEYEAAIDHGVDQGFDDCASGSCPVK